MAAYVTRGCMKLLPVLLITLLCSCGRNKGIPIRNVQEVLKDSIVLRDIHTDAELSYGQNVSGHLTISYYSRRKDKLYTYDARTKTTRSIDINPGIAKREFYISADTTLYILDGNKMTVLKAGLYRDIHMRQNDTLPITLYSMYMPFKIFNNHMLLQTLRGYDIRTAAGRSAFLSSEILHLYRIEGDSLQTTTAICSFPEEYKRAFHYEFAPKCAYNTKGKKVYYLFDNSNTIYEYDLAKNKVRPHAVAGLALNNQQAFDTTKLADITYAQKYLLENSQYFSLLYDDVQNNLVVIQKSGIAPANEREELNVHEDHPILVYTIGSNYTVNKILKFENSRHHKFPFSYYYDGMLYLPGRDTRVKDDKRELTVYVYGVEL